MKFMKCFSVVIAAFLSVLFLASCGTDLYLDQAVPADINMGRGARVCVSASYSPYAPELVGQVERRLINGGFYQLVASPVLANAHLNLDIDVHRDHTYDSDKHHDKKKDKKKHDHYTSDRYNVRVTSRAVWQDGSVIGSKTYTDSFYGRDNFPASSLGRNIAADLIPHMGSYSVNIDTSSEKPLLEQAAKACKAGNWEQGKILAKQYADQTNDPEGYFLLGVIARKSGNESQAIQYFNKAASRNPSISKYSREIARGGELRQRQEVMNAQIRG